MSLANEVEAKVRAMRSLLTDQSAWRCITNARFLLDQWAKDPGSEIEGIALQVAALCSMAAEREMLTRG